MVPQSMIVFYGHPGDTPMQMTIAAAAEHNVDRVVVDQAHTADDDVVLDIGPAGVTGYLVVGRQHIDLDEISAVYARPLAPLVTGDSAGARRAQAWHHIITEWLDTTTALVVNRPSAMASNASKPFQQQLIAEHFAVPDTLVTSCPQDVRGFWREHGAVVFKSTSGIRSIVRRLDEPGAQRLDAVALLPTQFQGCVAGVDVRVHVVGSVVFATEIHSSAVDYRYAHRDGLHVDLTPVRLCDDVEQRCVGLAATLDLPLCGIDLRRTPDGRYVCFEVNPMPGFSYYEAETGAPISSALVDLLSGKAS
jgi:glutathione synthase/RimK-type ligase-like ATP-grasp enzyme